MTCNQINLNRRISFFSHTRSENNGGGIRLTAESREIIQLSDVWKVISNIDSLLLGIEDHFISEMEPLENRQEPVGKHLDSRLELIKYLQKDIQRAPESVNPGISNSLDAPGYMSRKRELGLLLSLFDICLNEVISMSVLFQCSFGQFVKSHVVDDVQHGLNKMPKTV